MPKLSKVFTEKKHLDFLIHLGFNLEADIEDHHPKTNNFLLHELVIAGDTDIVRVLLKHHVDINKINDGSMLSYKKTPLLLAIYSQHFTMCQLLLQQGADPQQHDTTGYSPLMEAAQCGNLAALALLVTANVNLDEENVLIDIYSHYSAVIFAASSGHADVAIFLIESGAKLINSKGSQLLEYGDLITYQRLRASIQACTNATLALQTQLAQAGISTDIINLISSYTPGFSFVTEKEGFFISSESMDKIEKIKRADFPDQIPKEDKEQELISSSEDDSLQIASAAEITLSKEVSVSSNHARFFSHNNDRRLNHEPLMTCSWLFLPSLNSPSKHMPKASINSTVLWQDFRNKAKAKEKIEKKAGSSLNGAHLRNSI